MLRNCEDGSTAESAVLQPADGTLPVVRRLRRAFLSICRCGDVRLSPYHLTTEQYALMRVVQCNPGIRQMDLTDRIIAEPNTITAMVSLLERRGILRRRPCSSDRRARLLYLTTHGQALTKRLSEDWELLREVLRKCFSGNAGERALEILDTVYAEMTGERQRLLEKGPAGPVITSDLAESVDDGRPPASRARRAKPGRAEPQRRPHKYAKTHSQAKVKA